MAKKKKAAESKVVKKKAKRKSVRKKSKPSVVKKTTKSKSVKKVSKRKVTKKTANKEPPVKANHNIASVRQTQGISLRALSKRGAPKLAQLKEEQDSADILLSRLYWWARELAVPPEDLLILPDTDGLSRPVDERARLIRLMKTAKSLQADEEVKKHQNLRRLVEMMITQLTEEMPELAQVGPWHNVGQKRSLNEPSRTEERRLDTSRLDISKDD